MTSDINVINLCLQPVIVFEDKKCKLFFMGFHEMVRILSHLFVEKLDNDCANPKKN